MKIKILFYLILLISSICKGQNSVTTNEVIKTSDNKFGVKSKSGKILIDTIYDGIAKFYNLGRKTLPPNNNRYNNPVEFYLVIKETEKAVFDKDGKIVFDFAACSQLELDDHTSTVVKIVTEENNRLRSYLYGFDGNQIFEESFENIGYINNSDLIALIAEDGQNDEFYLYNPFKKKKLGPFSRFNIFNIDSSPPIGMEKEDFKNYYNLNIITVRQNFKDKYKWGLIDMQGNEILPIAYKYFQVIDKVFKSRVIDSASQPAGIEFSFYSCLFDNPHKILLIDNNMEQYTYDNDTKVITKVK